MDTTDLITVATGPRTMDLLVTDQEAGPDQVVAVMARDLVAEVVMDLHLAAMGGGAKLSPLYREVLKLFTSHFVRFQ